MNRPGAVPQSLRGMPTGFGGQQQPQQPGRTVSGRLPNGKLANNGGGWAFGSVPMGGAALQTSSRQLGGNLSFAQSLSGSQPATPLDLSEFPSLSNTSQLPSAGGSSLWSAGGSRGMGGAIQRNQQPTPLSAQHAPQQDDFFSPSRMTSGQGQYRFGSQNNVAQSSQPQPSSIDDFPPLNNNNMRNGNGEIGQERGSSLMSTLGFGAQGNAAPGSLPGPRSGNGLLNALSANTRTTDVRSPDGSTAIGASRPQDIRSTGSGANEEGRQKPPGFREDSITTQSATQDAPESVDGRNPLGAIGTSDAPSGKNSDEKANQPASVHDPLAGMTPIDKWGIKGLRALMNNYPDYNAAVTGLDPTTLGIDFTSPQPLSTQVFSLFNDTPPRPGIPEYRLPECYNVNNVQPLENKISNFNEETLMWIFYSCPGDIKQHMAAHELYNRAWRWHKKLKIWLTKDEIMQPRILSAQHEEGYYIIWNTTDWRKERRTLTLHYADLETNNSALP
ncbi:uncharacterized protein GGS22DRAFT_64691 [Annulohypoxylon maeteangense]|uniref:uncharacterized protein n=1 Tax=Annulohypoxylon maeteangense TaxID=1927788 RepID=UPI002008BD9A|nr:uncharacterized protein GGS22DRAFT_64691 [Annulohypoxylon maeteangense]KAI0888916.1 hypothetical protein GGS22DRAFT_64691 [Annulohypoxylon maeteangense]